jgi:hypothetical protein
MVGPPVGAVDTHNDLSTALLAATRGAKYPIAPGTCGTAVTILLPGRWQILPGSSSRSPSESLYRDPRAPRRSRLAPTTRAIVIDEVAGYLVTMIPVDKDHWAPLVVGFVVFRFFDIVKPPPVRWLDENLPGGWGVVLDDVAAGVMGAIVMGALAYFGVFEALAGL